MDSVFRTIKLTVITFVVSGLAAYGYSFKRQRFEFFTVITVYTFAVIIIYCAFYVGDIINDITSENFDIHNVSKLYTYMNILAGLVSYLTFVYYAQRQIVFMNDAKIRLLDVIFYLDDGKNTYKRRVIKLAVKALLFPIFLEITLLVRALHFEPNRSLLWTIYSLIPYIIRTSAATSVYGCLLLCVTFYELINIRIERIVREVRQIPTLVQTPFHRMQRYCDLSDEIDQLNEKHNTIIDVSNELLHLSALPWMGSILCNVVGIIMGLFTQYKSVADTIINGKEFDWYNVMTDSAFMFISFLEIFTQSNVCSTVIEEVRTTGSILQKANSASADVRYRQAVEFFSLRILQRNYKIKPLGLFEMDVSLVHGVAATATGFLLILIQSDLSRRFFL